MNADPADLANLRDIVLTAPVPFWPPAPGWWVVAAGLVAALFVVVARAVHRYRRNAYRRAALAELQALGMVHDEASARKAAEILKRVALVSFPRTEVSRLTGEEWLAFLDRTGGMDAFSRGPARQLPALALGYGVAGAPDGAAIMRAAADWVRRHRPANGGG